MREVIIKKGVKLRSPWLRIGEAAVYCGLSESAFRDHAKGLDHGGDSRNRRYHVNVLDKWVNNEFPDCPFTPDREDRRKPRKRIRVNSNQEDMSLVHPNTGKVFV